MVDKPLELQTEVDKATSAFEALMTPPEERPEAASEETQETAELADETVEEEVVEELELQDDDGEETEEETLDAEQNESEAVEEPTLYGVKINGEDVSVTLDELQNSYSRQADYTRKTQELASQKKVLEQQQAELGQQNSLYSELIPKLQTQLKTGLGDYEKVDWEQLYADDPIGYVRQRDKWNEQKEQLAAAESEQQRLKQESAQKYNEQVQNYMAYGEQQLQKDIPEWKNAEVAQAEKLKIRQYAIDQGFTAEEINQVYDWRLLKIMRDAYKHSSTKKAAKKKPKQKAAARVARPGTVKQTKSTTPLKKAKTRLKKTGKVQDAARVFEQLI